jgi:hypothetical protein
MDRRRSSYASASPASHSYQAFNVGYSSAAGYAAPVAPTTPAAYPSSSNHYSDYELQPSVDGGLSSAYYATPRSIVNAGQAPMSGQSMSPSSAPMSPYAYNGATQPIPMGRSSYNQHPSAPIVIPGGAYAQQGFMPSSSPHSPGAGSPDSPLSPLAHYAYSQSPPDASGMSAAGGYPASQQRPYACDLCVLSFSRQHDLKRHRDTHSGMASAPAPVESAHTPRALQARSRSIVTAHAASTLRARTLLSVTRSACSLLITSLMLTRRTSAACEALRLVASRPIGSFALLATFMIVSLRCRLFFDYL